MTEMLQRPHKCNICQKQRVDNISGANSEKHWGPGFAYYHYGLKAGRLGMFNRVAIKFKILEDVMVFNTGL